MNARKWNSTLFSALAVLVIVVIPFLALAQSFGDFDSFGFGDVDSFGFGDFDSFGFGDFNTFSFGDFSTFTPGDIGSPSGDTSGPSTTGTTPGTGTTGPGFDPFDDDLGPFGGLPGNPPGGDTIPQPPITIPPVTPPTTPPTTPPSTPPVGTVPTGGSSSPSEDSLKIFIHNIFLNNPFEQSPGAMIPLRITLENDGTRDLDNTKVIVMIPDLAVRASAGPFDLDSGKKTTQTMFLQLSDDVRPGTYAVRVQVYNEAKDRIVHREIDVIDHS